MTNLLAGLFDIVVAAAMILVFFRFMLQFAGITAKDAFAKPIYRMTRIVDVFGRIFPTLGDGRINTASLVLLFLLTQATDNRELYERNYRQLFGLNVVVATSLMCVIAWLAVRLVLRLAVVAANAADQLLDAAKPAAARAAMACECTWAGYEEAVVCCMAEVLTGEVGGKAITFPGAGQPNSRISRPAPAQGVCGVASLRKTCSR